MNRSRTLHLSTLAFAGALLLAPLAAMADHIAEQQKLVADALLNPFNDQVAE